jgi:hypothetical protein
MAKLGPQGITFELLKLVRVKNEKVFVEFIRSKREATRRRPTQLAHLAFQILCNDLVVSFPPCRKD